MRLLQNGETVLLNRCSKVESKEDQNQLMVRHVGQQLTTPEEGADFIQAQVTSSTASPGNNNLWSPKAWLGIPGPKVPNLPLIWRAGSSPDFLFHKGVGSGRARKSKIVTIQGDPKRL